MTIATIGLDLAKSVFQLRGVDAEGRTVLKRRLRRQDLLSFFERLAPGGGPLTATALVAAIGDGARFQSPDCAARADSQVSCRPAAPVVMAMGEARMRRVLGIDIHRTFGEVVIRERGVLRHAGRVT